MSLHQEANFHLPSTLEPRQDDHSTFESVITKTEPLNSYVSSRQLPALNTLQNNHQPDDYIRIKLSGMSVGVSPNSSPRGHLQYQHEQRGEDYFSSPVEEEQRCAYDPIRSSLASGGNTPLLRRIIHQDQSSHRRHSIANMDLRSTAMGNNNNEIKPNIYQSNQQHLHQHQHNSPNPIYPGHYSAPSSPPMHHTHTKSNTKQQQLPSPFSPYNYSKSSKSTSFNMDDDMAPPPLPQMRRNSSALVYRGGSSNIHRESLASRRMSSSSLSRMNQIGNSINNLTLLKQEEHNSDSVSNIKSQRDETEGLYSRSPELRISHKLAERKRRKEMKDLFEELRDALPVDKSMKTSKWEILSKAVEYIGILRHRDYNMEQELGMLKHELEALKSGKSPLASNVSMNYSGVHRTGE